MKIGPRLLRRDGPFADEAMEVKALRRTLDTAPGVASVHSVRAHHKGGHVVSMEVDPELLDAFIGYLNAEGWMSVV
jgi:predicted methyltransferase